MEFGVCLSRVVVALDTQFGRLLREVRGKLTAMGYWFMALGAVRYRVVEHPPCCGFSLLMATLAQI